MVTGESIPVEKTAREPVIGGSINQSGSLIIGVTRVGEESFLRQVARHIEEARSMKPSILQLVDVVPLNDYDQQTFLRLGAGAEAPSEHPLARAVVERAQEAPLDFPQVSGFRAMPGKGVQVSLDGQQVRVGSLRFLEEQGVALSVGLERAEALEEHGKTVVGVAANGTLAGLIAIADTLKPDAKEAVRQLKEAGIESVMITGDNWRTARAVAAEVGIDEVLAQVLPDEKADRVRGLQRQGVRVAIVGDGINDAPALMQADVGTAIGAGTDIAIESSDVILVGERLTAVLDAYHIGRSSYQKTVQNLILAFSFNGIGVPAATTGLVHPVWAMIAMVLSVSTVLVNSFAGRLLPRAKEAGRGAPEVHTLELHAPSMHCQGCLSTITQAVTRLPEPVALDFWLANCPPCETLGQSQTRTHT